MRTVALGPSVEISGATKHVTCVPKWACETYAGGGTGAFGGAPYEATNRVRGVPESVSVTHAGGSTGAFGGAPCGATKRAK
eukprot:5599596-Pyramimonas_sp.AAC.1